MSKEKNSKLEVKSDKEDFESSEENTKRLLSFDVYFQKLIAMKKGILPHHKAPMQKFAEQMGCTDASEEEFEEIFRSY